MNEVLDYMSKTLLEFMCRGFMGKNDEEAWEFLEDISWKDMQWDSPPENSSLSTSMSKSSLYSFDSFIAAETKVATFRRRIEPLKISSTPHT